MRITTSPYMVSSKGFSSNTISPVSYNSNGTRSSSLTNSDIMHKRLVSDRQFNQNSYLVMNDNSKYHSPLITKQLIQKSTTNEYGILENPNTIQQKMNNMQKSIQQINKKLIKQSQQIKTLQTSSNQNQSKEFLIQKQKIHQQIQMKLKEANQGLLNQIKQINKQIYQRIDQIKNIKITEINNASVSALNEPGISGIFSNSEKPVNYQLLLKKVKLTIDQKLNSEIFKLRLFVENQVFKSANFYKSTQDKQTKCIFTKSTLKYSFKPLKLVQRQSLNVQQTHHQNSSKIKENDSNKKKQKHSIQIQSSKQVYYLDDNGYLLDEQGYYLLDSQKKMIKVTKPMLQKLKDLKMLK